MDPMKAMANADEALRHIDDALKAARSCQDNLERSHPKGRHVALAVTKLEEAQMWLTREV